MLCCVLVAATGFEWPMIPSYLTLHSVDISMLATGMIVKHDVLWLDCLVGKDVHREG